MGVSKGSKVKKKKKQQKGSAPALVAASKKREEGASSSHSLFETAWSRRKFDILGKKRKGEGVRVGLARSLAVQKRKKTLLQEYKQKGKANTFLDNRFGEDNEGLAEQDKAIIRFQRERQVQLQRKSKFALQDEEDEFMLTHRGVALSTLDDFNDDIELDDGDDLGELDDKMAEQLHFGGGNYSSNEMNGTQNERPRSKKEIMEEVIAKSKHFKAQRAKDKEEDTDLMDRLDKEFAALTQSQSLASLFRPRKADSLKSLLKTPSKRIDTVPVITLVESKDKPDDFDKLVKEMGMESRAHASDRSKTAEELAAEEKSHLEELEIERRKRMLGEVDSDSGTEIDDAEKEERKGKRRKEISGDDLGENFMLDEDKSKKGWVDEAFTRSSEGECESEDEDDDEDEDEDEDEDDEEREESSESLSSEQEWEESDEREEKHHILESTKRLGAKTIGKEKSAADEDGKMCKLEDLPYIISAPKDFEEFQRLISHREVEELVEAIRRIRACNSICLAADNRRKMQVFYGVLLQYFATLGGGKCLDMARLNALVKPLIEMTSETPYFAAHCARQRMVRMRNQLSAKLRDPGGSGCWPSVRELLLFRLWSMIFPPSDFRHVVMTPMTMLMAEYLLRCPVKSGRDIAVGMFLCSILLSVLRPSKRFCPEALTFLHASLVSSLPESMNSEAKSRCGALMGELTLSKPWLLPSKDSSTLAHVDQLDFNSIMASNESSLIFDLDTYRIAALLSIIQTVHGFASISEDFPSFPEIFRPFILVLHNMALVEFFPAIIKVEVKRLNEYLEEKISVRERLRQPLMMRVKKLVPIKQFNPKFEENFVLGRNYDPDRERAERKRVQRQVKKEARGAARELRKDNYFLQDEKMRERSIADEEKAEKRRKVMAFMEEQESAFRSGQLGKRGGRRRRKRD